MVYFGLLEDDRWCPPTFGFGECGKVSSSMFCNASEEVIGEFGVVDDDGGVDGVDYEGLPP